QCGNRNGLDRIDDRLQMNAGYVQVNGSGFQVDVSEQHLDGAQIGPIFQKMSGKAVTHRVWRYAFMDSGLLRCVVYCSPHTLGCEGFVGTPAVHRTEETDTSWASSTANTPVTSRAAWVSMAHRGPDCLCLGGCGRSCAGYRCLRSSTGSTRPGASR